MPSEALDRSELEKIEAIEKIKKTEERPQIEFDAIQPVFFKEPKKVMLSLRNGSKIEVTHLGEDYYGTYNGRRVWCPIYSYEAIKKLADEIKYAIAHNWDQPIAVTGRERSGKSDFSLHLIYNLRNDYDLNKITWNQKQFRDATFNAQFYDLIWMDEAGEALFSQEWYKREQRDLVKAFLRFGIKRLTTILVLPHIMLLNKQLRERRLWWWIEVYAKDVDDRGYAQVRKGPLKQNPFDTSVFWHGVFTIRFPPFRKLYPDIWKKYEELKIKALEETDSEPDKKEEVKASIWQNRIIEAAKKLHEQGYTVPQIAEILSTAKRTIYSYLEEAKKCQKLT